MDLTRRLLDAPAPTDPDAHWAASGALWLTGHSDGLPLLAAQSAPDTLVRLAGRLASVSATAGTAVVVDGPALLGERAALAGGSRRGRTSVGGATRLVRGADGWLAVSLPRPSDLELVPAWLGVTADRDDPWPDVIAALARRPVAGAVGAARQLGLACAALGETPPGALALAHAHGDAASTTDLRDVSVADLTALWAGPLCADLLARAGAQVVKVESVQRPDGARAGNPGFYALLNDGKHSTTVDLSTASGREHLAALVAGADVVLESSRPRALAQLGIDAARVLARGRTRVWCSITGHGRAGELGGRVGFGDDAAVAGGLVARDGDGLPVFCADAAADPSSGLVAAVAVLDRLVTGGRWLIDIALARTAAVLACGPVAAAPWTGPVARPHARPPRLPVRSDAR